MHFFHKQYVKSSYRSVHVLALPQVSREHPKM